MASLAVFLLAFAAGCLSGYGVRQWQRHRDERVLIEPAPPL